MMESGLNKLQDRLQEFFWGRELRGVVQYLWLRIASRTSLHQLNQMIDSSWTHQNLDIFD